MISEYHKSGITYHLTRTVPGPRVKIKTPEEGFELLNSWLQAHTIGYYRQITLNVYNPGRQTPELELLDNEFRRNLSGGYADDYILEWQVVPPLLKDLFAIIRTYHDFLVAHQYYVVVDCSFIFLGPTGQPLERQNLYELYGHSSLMAFIRNKEISIEPSLYFPFREPNQDFQDFYTRLEAGFPFRLNKRNLYLNSLAPGAKEGYISRKLHREEG